MTLPRMRLFATFSLVLALSACQSDPAGAPAGPTVAETSPTASVDSIPQTALRAGDDAGQYDAPVTLVSMQNGDRACYIDVQDDAGTRTELADFRLCERDDLVGTRVILTATPSQIQAASCEGDPECRDMEPVNLVTGIDPVTDEPLPPAPEPEL